MKHLTVEAEQWVMERIATHNDNLRGWKEPNGLLIPTEPDPEERDRIRIRLSTANVVLIELLVKFCGRLEEELLQLTFVNGSLYGPSASRKSPSILRQGHNYGQG